MNLVQKLRTISNVKTEAGWRGLGTELSSQLQSAARRTFRSAGEVLDRMLPASSERVLARDAGEYWSASDSDAGIRDFSHWAGVGRWNSEEWLAIGRKHLRMYDQFSRCLGDANALSKVIEWGPGGGSNAVAFASRAERFTAVDISEANLRECASRVANLSYRGFSSVLISAESPEAALEQVRAPQDLFLCTAVYQHFPSREYGRRVTEIACRILAPGGRAIIQIRYDDGSLHYAPKHRAYQRNAITFTSYGLDEFWSMAGDAGLQPVYIMLEPGNRYAYFFLVKGKT